MSFSCSRRRFLRDSLGLLAVAQFPQARAHAASTAPTDVVDVGAMLRPVFEGAGIPGGAAVVMRGDQIMAQGCAGVRRRGGREAITIDDRFHLGSCTKAMTATLAGVAVDQKNLNWASTIPELFAKTGIKIDPGWSGVTLRHLLAHRAGVPANLGSRLTARLSVSRQLVSAQRRQIVEEILGRAPESAPGSQFVYSNVGFVLVGAALEVITGNAWEDLMRRELFAPLAITTGGFGPPGTPERVDQPRGHRGPAGEPVEPGGRRGDNPAAIGPAGTVHMAMKDWAKFIAVHVRGDAANPRRNLRLLSAESFDQLHCPRDGETYVGGWGTGARAWAKGGRPGDRGFVLTHAGSNTLWYCVAWLAPEIDFAALVACNAAGEGVPKACDRIAGELIRRFAAA